ncbi:Kinesin light chain [Trichoplax sp. H2]|nr:Kinesin light chain [Trichoplax sp. H2]|eukprot:RDD39773.1 Kinesin light chain [Trichoplax sp. H2]
MADDQSTHFVIPPNIQTLYKKGKECKTACNFVEELSCYTQALEEIQMLSNPHIVIKRLRCDIYLDICLIHTLRYEWTEANKWKEKGQHLADKLQDEVRIAKCLDMQCEIKRMQLNFNGALEDCNKSLEMKTKYLKEGDVCFADNYHQLGRICIDQQNYKKALEMLDKSLEIRLLVLGPNHSDVARIYYSIAVVYSYQLKNDDALSMFDKSLKIQLSVLNGNHPDIANTYNSIGLIYCYQGKYDEAHSAYDKSLKIRLSVLGDNHPDVAQLYNNIGFTYHQQGEYNKALEMFDKSLNIALPIYGEGHPEVRLTRNNIRRATMFSLPTSAVKSIFHGVVKLFKRDQTSNDSKPANSDNAISDPSCDISYQVKDSQEMKYYNAYIKVLNLCDGHNNLIRGIFIGPRGVGKSSIRKVFSQQNLIGNASPTQVVENTGILVNTEDYRLNYLENRDWTKILDDKVKAAIKQLAETSMDNQDKFNQQIGQFATTDNLSETNPPGGNTPFVLVRSNLQEVEIPSKETEIESESKLSLRKYYLSSNFDQMADERHNNQFVKLWDFGGHPIYHVTHYPFISANSIYILVFDITQELNNKVKIRKGELSTGNMTYLQAMQEWLKSIIGCYRSQSTITVKINDKDKSYQLPIIIMVASHGDCITDNKKQTSRFNKFVSGLMSSMPAYARNIYSSGIIFNCNPDHTSESTKVQRQQCCHRLLSIIKTFIRQLPFMSNPIPIRWYIMAALLKKSIHNEATSSDNNEIRNSQVRNIMTMKQMETLAQEYGLFESREKMIAMLKYLHDLGEVIYCDNVRSEAIIITNVDWLLNIFRSIIPIQVNNFTQEDIPMKQEYDIACLTGRLSRRYIDEAILKFDLDENNTRTILELMEAYDILCTIRSELDENGTGSQYFVPYLLQQDVAPFDLSTYHVSDWLYIGYKQEDIPYLPDGIYYCLLSSCLREWNNTDVEVYYQCAKYYLVNDNYYLIVKKEKSHIGLQYCYQKSDPPAIYNSVIDKVKNSIFVERTHNIVKNKLIAIMKMRMMKFQEEHCRFYVKCSKCSEQIPIVKEYKKEDENLIRCQHCKNVLSSQSLNDWIIYKEELWNGLLIDYSYFHLISLEKKIYREEKERECFDLIAAKLDGDCLLRFGVLLKLTDIKVKEIISSQNGRRYDKVYNVLKSWKDKAGMSPKISAVVEALRKMEINALAEEVEQKLTE